MRILAFDQSVRATAAVILEEVSDGQLSVVGQSVGRIGGSGIYRMMRLKFWIDEVFRKNDPFMVVREMHNQRQFGAAAQLQVVGAIIDQAAYENEFLDDYRYAVIPPGTWKKFCLGKGNLKKDTAYMIHINRFIQNSSHLSALPQFQVLDDNIGDAICLGVCAYVARRIAKNEPALISDASRYNQLKKVLPTLFDYGEEVL
ncbi:MAG: hypothetical protein CMB80_00775 [Flammeovirgaceae bacterium]|nr:hypothetical protein [Flammeovirgaceae bacterium]|tara:strand:+ start:663 stop:1265 length:603 start_codon:yes stop_codon:yes gene_type:complete